MQALVKVILVLLSLLIIFFIFTTLHNFYSGGRLVGAHFIPTEEGFSFLLETLWSAVVMLAMVIGSLFHKTWAWHLLLFMTIYSILMVVASLIFNPDDKLINYLKLFFYFALVRLMVSKVFLNYYRIQIKKQSFYAASVAAIVVFVFYMQY